MSIKDAVNSASIAQGQAVAAVNVVQARGIRTDEDRYQENMALAVANLSIAVKQLAESIER